MATLSGRSSCTIPSILDAGHPKFVTRGSTATGLSLAHAGVGPEHSVLLPAYHCTSMVKPVVWRGAKPVFYKIKEDTSVDLDDVEAKLDRTSRVLLVPHYFGFPQDNAAIRSFCDKHGLVYLEDCAHSFFGSSAGKPLGAFGDYAIASPWKFFPTFDGGIIVSAVQDLNDIRLISPGAYFDAKSALNSLEYSFGYDRLSLLKVLLCVPLLIKEWLWRTFKSAPRDRKNEDGGESDAAAEDFPLFDPAWVDKRASLPARLIVEHAAKDRIVEKRRRNFARLAAGLGDLKGAHVLFPDLPDGVVPHVFPLVVAEPERAFDALKLAGVPIIRFGEFLWPGVDRTTCPVAAEYSRKVFQFPCHQDLGDDDVDWMIGNIQRVISGAQQLS